MRNACLYLRRRWGRFVVCLVGALVVADVALAAQANQEVDRTAPSLAPAAMQLADSGSKRIGTDRVSAEKRMQELLAAMSASIDELRDLKTRIDANLTQLDTSAAGAFNARDEARTILRRMDDAADAAVTAAAEASGAPASCREAQQAVASLQAAATSVAARGKGAADLIATSGDAPESLTPLSAALAEIRGMAEELRAAQETRTKLAGSLAAVAGLWSAQPTAALGGPPGGQQEKFEKILARAEAAVADATRAHAVNEAIAKDEAEFYKRKADAVQVARRLHLVVPDSMAFRHADIDVLIETVQAVMPAIDATGTRADVRAKELVGEIDGLAQDLLALGEQAADRVGKDADLAAARTRSLVLDKGCDLGRLGGMQGDANAALEDIEASVIAILFVYASRVEKIQDTLGKYDQLFLKHEDNIRIANGQLKMLVPLIAERQGRSDAKSQADLKKLLEEKARVEALKRQSEEQLAQLGQWREADKQEAALLARGQGEMQAVEQQVQALQPLSLVGIAGGAGTEPGQ